MLRQAALACMKLLGFSASRVEVTSLADPSSKLRMLYCPACNCRFLPSPRERAKPVNLRMVNGHPASIPCAIKLLALVPQLSWRQEVEVEERADKQS